MRNRTPLYTLAGIIIAVVLVYVSTNIAEGNKRSSQGWIRAQQKTQLLWMVDGCALIIVVGSWMLGAAIASLQSESSPQADENARHILILTRTVEDLFSQNNEYASRLEALEQTGDAWHEGFEEEARRLTEQAFLALSDNIETNALQLEAVNLALRYQRAEMQAVRAAFKTGEFAPPLGSPPPLDAVDRPIKPVLPEWRKPQNEIEAKEPDADSEIESEFEHSVDADAGRYDALSDSDSEMDDSSDLAPLAEVEQQQSDANRLDPDEEPPAELEDETDMEPPSHAPDETVNAGTTVVETLEFDAAVVGDRDAQDTPAKTARAADEFRRSKQERQSIFRQKRR